MSLCAIPSLLVEVILAGTSFLFYEGKGLFEEAGS